MVWYLVGAGAAALCIVAGRYPAKRKGVPSERVMWSAFLVLAALIYVGFTLRGAPMRWVMIELAGVAVYGLVALGGARRWPALVGLGWGAHALWDTALHNPIETPYVPEWYPPACLGFDVVLGIYLLTRLRAWTEK